MENYCKQQNLDFIDSIKIKKFDLNSRGLHLRERDSSKLAKISWIIFTEFVLQVIAFLTNLNRESFALLKNQEIISQLILSVSRGDISI